MGYYWTFGQQQRQDGWAVVYSQFKNIPASECKTKWQTLRSQQRRIVRDGTSSTTKWIYFHQLPPLSLYDTDALVLDAQTTDRSDCSQHIEPGDEWKHFGDFVACKLRGIADHHTAHTVKENIRSYLFTFLPQVMNTRVAKNVWTQKKMIVWFYSISVLIRQFRCQYRHKWHQLWCEHPHQNRYNRQRTSCRLEYSS